MSTVDAVDTADSTEASHNFGGKFVIVLTPTPQTLAGVLCFSQGVLGFVGLVCVVSIVLSKWEVLFCVDLVMRPFQKSFLGLSGEKKTTEATLHELHRDHLELD